MKNKNILNISRLTPFGSGERPSRDLDMYLVVVLYGAYNETKKSVSLN